MLKCSEVTCFRQPISGMAVCQDHLEDAGRLMFNIWAISNQTTSEGSHVLIQAGFHLHVSNALEQIIPPLPPLVKNGEYHRQLVLQRIYQVLGQTNPNSDDAVIAQDLIMYSDQFDDEPDEIIEWAVKEWRDRKVLSLLEA